MPNRREKPRQSPVVIEVVPLPTPRINLHDMEALRREMGKVYRDMRTGKLVSQDGARLVYVLGEMRKLIEADGLERRIQALEAGNGYDT
jgi:hypothetical protein